MPDYLVSGLNVKWKTPYNLLMQIPRRIPGLRPLIFLAALYAAIWIALEGDLSRVMLLALLLALAGLGTTAEKVAGGRTLSRPQWLLFAGLWGLLLGGGSALLALLLMAVKTGLHAHGPEFSTAEIAWLLSQLPWWATGGMLAGFGIALIAGEIWPADG